MTLAEWYRIYEVQSVQRWSSRMGEKAARLWWKSVFQLTVGCLVDVIFVAIIVVGVMTQSPATRHVAWGIGFIGIAIGFVGVWTGRRTKLAIAEFLQRPPRDARRVPLLRPDLVDRWLRNHPRLAPPSLGDPDQ